MSASLPENGSLPFTVLPKSRSGRGLGGPPRSSSPQGSQVFPGLWPHPCCLFWFTRSHFTWDTGQWSQGPGYSGGSEEPSLGHTCREPFPGKGPVAVAPGCGVVFWGRHPAHDKVIPTLKVSEFRSQGVCGPRVGVGLESPEGSEGSDEGINIPCPGQAPAWFWALWSHTPERLPGEQQQDTGPFTHTETPATGCRERALGSVGRGQHPGCRRARGGARGSGHSMGGHVPLWPPHGRPRSLSLGAAAAACLGPRGRARHALGAGADLGHPSPRTGSAAGESGGPGGRGRVSSQPGRLWGGLGRHLHRA